MQQVFIAVSSLLALISPLIYAMAILKGEAKPHRTTRLVLLIITSLSTASLFVQGSGVAVWLAGVSMLQSILIFALSIKHGMGGWSKMNLTCLAIATIGIILWQITKNPTLALYASIAADLTGMIPAIIRTYRLPDTEVWSFFLLDVFAGLFSLFATAKWSVQEISYPVYILTINFVMVILIIRPKLAFKKNISL